MQEPGSPRQQDWDLSLVGGAPALPGLTACTHRQRKEWVGTGPDPTFLVIRHICQAPAIRPVIRSRGAIRMIRSSTPPGAHRHDAGATGDWTSYLSSIGRLFRRWKSLWITAWITLGATASVAAIWSSASSSLMSCRDFWHASKGGHGPSFHVKQYESAGSGVIWWTDCRKKA